MPNLSLYYGNYPFDFLSEVDCEIKADGNRWLHVSVSRSDRIPGHRDMAEVKRAFIGDRYAYSVWPPTGSYVNIHPNWLHLWSLWDAGDGRVLPEFSEVLPGIGRSV